jgi:hypothetical protein
MGGVSGEVVCHQGLGAVGSKTLTAVVGGQWSVVSKTWAAAIRFATAHSSLSTDHCR